MATLNVSDELKNLLMNYIINSNDFATILLNKTYPKGSVYISTKSEPTPASLFGGEWALIENRFLYAVNLQTASKQLLGSNTNDHTHNTYIGSHGHGHGLWVPINHNNGAIRGVEINVSGYNDTYRASASGSSETVWQSQGAPVWGDVWGTDLGTKTSGGASNTNNMPAYFTVYAWHRIN